MTSGADRPQSLRTKFLRVTIPLIFLSVIGVFSVIEFLTHQNAVARLERSLDGQIKTQAAALANPLWNLDDEQIELALAAIVTGPEILMARVLGEGGQTVSSAGDVPATDLSDDLMYLSREIVFDAGAGPNVIGELEFVATRQLLWSQTRNRLIVAALIALVTASIQVAAALFALRTIIGRPLEALLASIKTPRGEGEERRVDWESADELGQVITAYNEMQDRQVAYERKLRRAKDTLEERVSQRTAELAEARDDAEMAQMRLNDAIEAVSDGFSLYDRNDRLVIANSRYNEILNIADENVIPGQSFEDVLSSAVESGLISEAEDDPQHWMAERLERHRNPGSEHIQQFARDRWVRISESRTQDGGTVAVYTDVTEIKLREEELAAKSSQLEQLSNKLAKYLSPQVYESIFQGRQEVQLAATRKKLTVFFSDIENFTGTADRLESEDLTRLLNHYLTEMSKIALAYGATIDKFVGDAIVIFFGDPETRGVREDAQACVRMAMAMQKRMRELADEWSAQGIARPLRCRMGIHTDYCTVGNFGSEDRLDYTIIGRGVNIASRLEGLAEPGEILISYETHAQVNEEIECTAEGELSVKGMAYPVETYKVVGARQSASEDLENAETRLEETVTTELSRQSDTEQKATLSFLQSLIDKLEANKKAAE